MDTELSYSIYKKVDNQKDIRDIHSSIFMECGKARNGEKRSKTFLEKKDFIFLGASMGQFCYPIGQMVTLEVFLLCCGYFGNNRLLSNEETKADSLP